MTGPWQMPGGAGAAALAVKRVNADTKLLHGRTLRYSWADSGCSAKQGLVAMGELLEDDRIDSLIGPACSSACEVTSYLSAGRGIPQISWGCTSSTFSNKTEFELVRATTAQLSFEQLLHHGCVLQSEHLSLPCCAAAQMR